MAIAGDAPLPKENEKFDAALGGEKETGEAAVAKGTASAARCTRCATRSSPAEDVEGGSGDGAPQREDTAAGRTMMVGVSCASTIAPCDEEFFDSESLGAPLFIIRRLIGQEERCEV